MVLCTSCQLAAASFSWRGALLRAALGLLLDLAAARFLLGGLLASAERLANPAAHRLLLGLLTGFGFGGFLGRARVVLAADELDFGDLGAVAAAEAEAQQAGVAAGPRGVARRDRVEQLGHDGAV